MTAPTRPTALLAAAAAIVLLSACAAGGPVIGVGVSGGGGGASIGVGGSFPLGGLGGPGRGATPFQQGSLPAAVQVPAGHAVALETVGTGTVIYECRDRAGAPAGIEWTLVGPEATLTDRRGRTVGRYFGPPATWVAGDGSAITGTPVATVPAAAGSLPLQLVQATPAAGSPGGMLTGITHVQRVATQGGGVPQRACDAAGRGQRETVRYQADYIFWKPA